VPRFTRCTSGFLQIDEMRDITVRLSVEQEQAPGGDGRDGLCGAERKADGNAQAIEARFT